MIWADKQIFNSGGNISVLYEQIPADRFPQPICNRVNGEHNLCQTVDGTLPIFEFFI